MSSSVLQLPSRVSFSPWTVVLFCSRACGRTSRLSLWKRACRLPFVDQNDKKQQLEGKLQDIRFRLSAQRHEIESTNKTRELRIAEITHLQRQLQVRPTLPGLVLGRAIADPPLMLSSHGTGISAVAEPADPREAKPE